MNALQGIFTNAVALNAQRNLGVSQNSLAGIQAQLSSGLRINGARDDAAGLAISERLQANLKAQDSSIRSINQGISLVQVADGGLMNISESLQRGFELAVQAANGTLAASDRANLNAEFRQLHAEIDRIAEGTEIFGRYPLAATPSTTMGQTKSIKEVFAGGPTLNGQPSGLKPIGFIPAGATDVTITVDGIVGAEDDIQIFTADGKHLVGTPAVGARADSSWLKNGVSSVADVEGKLLTEAYGFQAGVSFDGNPPLVDYVDTAGKTYSQDLADGVSGTYKGMTFTYTGDGDRFPSDIDTTDGSTDAYHGVEKLHIDTVDEPLFLAVTGQGIFNINAQWGSMPDAPQPKNTGPVDIVVRADFERAVETVTVNSTPSDTKTLGLESVEIDPLEKAREALEKLKQAIDKINSYRSDYGAVNNRFDSAIGLIGQESVATAATRGQIVDADYAKNTAALTRLEIQQKVSNAMLAQANVNPKFLLTLLGG
jgi:flagellin